MSKKIDIKRTLGKTITPLSIDSVEEMTRLIHDKKPIQKTEVIPTLTTIVEEKKATQPLADKTINKPDKKTKSANYEKTTVETEKGKRGRKPKLIMEPERLLRVSVDLPESVFIQLKVHVIQQKTDMKAFIRKLVEKEMNK
jgi:hypothetical protein